MAIRKPGMTVSEARRLAEARAAEARGGPGTPIATSVSATPAGAYVPVPCSPVSMPEFSETVETDLTPGVHPEATPRAADPKPSVRPSRTVGGASSSASRHPEKANIAAPDPPNKPSAAANIDAVKSSRNLTEPVIKTQVFVSAPLPAVGVSSAFEILLQQYPPNKALQMILRRALDDYEQMLADGSFQKVAIGYPADATTPAKLVQTSHMMRQPLLALARAHFDPLGLESARAFGLKLATAALTVYFSREGRSKP